MEGSQSYRVTISTKGDVSPETELKFVKWVKKNCDMAYVVAERGSNDRRHIHGLLLFPMKRVKFVVQNYIWQNHVKPHHPDCIQKIAVVINTAFNFEWMDSYLQKETDKEELVMKWDKEHASKYLPTPEEQNSLVEQLGESRKGRAFHDHKYWTDMASHFKADYVRSTDSVDWKKVQPKAVLEWLNKEMLEGRMVVMTDDRRRVQKAMWLWRVITKTHTTLGIEDVLIEKTVNPYTDGRV